MELCLHCRHKNHPQTPCDDDNYFLVTHDYSQTPIIQPCECGHRKATMKTYRLDMQYLIGKGYGVWLSYTDEQGKRYQARLTWEELNQTPSLTLIEREALLFEDSLAAILGRLRNDLQLIRQEQPCKCQNPD